MLTMTKHVKILLEHKRVKSVLRKVVVVGVGTFGFSGQVDLRTSEKICSYPGFALFCHPALTKPLNRIESKSVNKS